ncbi:hypothetical protein JRQ81_001628 [Phrynocephalus forsythii]|uniref:SCP domain-containing protein n=1 Tax=Phrynocephalus forsythii TaxID=171643 RepID=A0A9Q1B813_9SAUR|nr:hypothetical protein JRQ81_001628 [Phrynocephalus forsythii]
MNPEKEKEILDTHNDIRREVQPTASNMLKMTWSRKAAKSARQRAAKCIPSVSPPEERTVDGVLCSENVLHSETAITWPNVIKVWQQKKSNFQYGVGTIVPKHDVYSYTQLIWYRSHLVGCASAYCTGTPYPFVHICQYCPAGNIGDQLQTPYTEGPPCGDCPYHCEDKLCRQASLKNSAPRSRIDFGDMEEEEGTWAVSNPYIKRESGRQADKQAGTHILNIQIRP